MKSSCVNCKVTNCIHNQGCDCMAGVINVKGIHAQTVNETICNTFIEEGGYSFDNLAKYNNDENTKTETVKCSATNCKYNENQKCYADEVQIIAANASCGTFECKL